MCSALRLTRAENDVRDPRLINPQGAQSSARNNERAVARNPDARKNVLVSISTLLHNTGNERANGHLENVGLQSKDVLPQRFHDDQSSSSAQSQNVFPSFSGREPDGDEEMRAVAVLPGQRGEHGAQGTQLKWLNLQYNTSKLQ